MALKMGVKVEPCTPMNVTLCWPSSSPPPPRPPVLCVHGWGRWRWLILAPEETVEGTIILIVQCVRIDTYVTEYRKMICVFSHMVVASFHLGHGRRMDCMSMYIHRNGERSKRFSGFEKISVPDRKRRTNPSEILIESILIMYVEKTSCKNVCLIVKVFRLRHSCK